ncbi:MAG: extensin family protein [bacterium]|nr:extensin family protein [bacterium]
MALKLKKIAVRILLGFLFVVCLIVVFGGMLFVSPRARRSLMNSPFGSVAISLYNQKRPLLHIGNGESCLAKLTKTKITFTRIPNRVEENGCALKNVVKVSRSGEIGYNHPFPATCSLLRSLNSFEQKIVQPLAKKYFKQSVARVNHFGSYNCRPMRGYHALLSEHAYANAIDISSFQLADGTLVSVQRDWKKSGKKSEFLHAIAKKACSVFQTVLTPNYNTLHRDHFHVDNGFLGKCGY